jgi:WD40 repeat protein
MLEPKERELLRRYISVNGDGNVVGNDNTVRVIKQSAGNYAVQIGEQHFTVTVQDLRRVFNISHSQIGVIGDNARVDQIIFQTAPEPPPPPFMVESLEGFVERPKEFERLIEYLLDEGRKTPVAITAALRGAGGYGKTTLARAICHDVRVRQAFPDGILWVTLGQTPNVLGGLRKLYAAMTGQRPDFIDIEDAANALAAQLMGRTCLIVVDDVWHPAHLRPLLRGGEHCARLITTRDGTTIPQNARTVDIDAMQQDEAVSLLGADLTPADLSTLRALARRVGEWPLLLKLVNGLLRRRVNDYGQSLRAALEDVQAALDRRGMTAFDVRDARERDQAVAKTVRLSLDMLGAEERQRYNELAVFPEDADVPLGVLERLWDLDRLETQVLCERFWSLSLLLRLDLAAGTIRLHDVMHAYLTREHVDQLYSYHHQLLNAYAKEVDEWPALSPAEPYLWYQLVYHLHAAERKEELRALLMNFDWLQAKLEATDVHALLADYEVSLQEEPDWQAHALVQSAIRLSAHVLFHDKTQLAGQLLGRLMSLRQPRLQSLLVGAAQWQGSPWLRPLVSGLTSPGGPLLCTITGHRLAITAVAVTPDGQRAISGSSDKTLKVWNLEDGKLVRTLKGHTSEITAIATMPDGRRMISASKDGVLKVWDLENGRLISTLKGHVVRITSVAVTPDGRAILASDGSRTLKVWDLDSKLELHTLTAHTSWVTAVAVTSDGQCAVSASDDETLKVWDLETGLLLNTLKGHSESVNAVTLMPDGRQAVSASHRTLKVWDLNDGVELLTMRGLADRVTTLAIAPDGRRVISISYDTLQVWDLERGAELQAITGTIQKIGLATVTSDLRVISASYKTLKVWDFSGNLDADGEYQESVSKKIRSIGRHNGEVTAVALTSDGRQAVSASYETLKVWDIEQKTELYTFTGLADAVFTIAVTPDGQRMISASWDILRVWDLERGAELHTMKDHRAKVNTVAVTPDGQHAISASDDETLKVWDLETGALMDTLEGHARAVNAVVITPNGRRVISASDDETLKVWDLETGALMDTLEGHARAVNAVVITPDGQRVVSASRDRKLKVWDLESGTIIDTLEGHTDLISSIAVTPDGQRIISASFDRTLKVWDLEHGKNLLTLIGHTDWVRGVAIMPVGRRTLSISEDKMLKIWDLGSGASVATFHAEGAIHACAVSPDGLIVAGDVTGTVHFLRLMEAET